MYLPTTDSRHVCNASQVLGKFFFFVLFFSLTTGCYSTPQAQDTSQTCLKYMVSFFFLLFVFLYTYNFTYYSVNMDSRRILSLTTALMVWTGRERGREKGRRRKRWGQQATEDSRCIWVLSPRYVFFFLSLYLFLLTLTYRLLQQLRMATMSHTTHWLPTDHQQPTTNLHHSPHPVPRRDTGTTTTILPPSHSVNDRSTH